MFGFFLASYCIAYLADTPAKLAKMRLGDVATSLAWTISELLLAGVIYLFAQQQSLSSQSLWIQIGAGLGAGLVLGWLTRELLVRKWRPNSAPLESVAHDHLPSTRFILVCFYVALACILYPYTATTPGLRGRSTADQVGGLACVVFFFLLSFMDAWLCGSTGSSELEHLIPAWAAAITLLADMCTSMVAGQGGSDTLESVGVVLVFGLLQITNIAGTIILPGW
jgi:hypothetical protein